MKPRSTLVFLSILILVFASHSRIARAAPAAPVPLAPADGAAVLVPFTISWSAVSDPSGIVGYNWQVSPSSSFSIVILQNSTSGQTQATVGGLNNGTYFWRVQAASGSFEQSAWSQPRSFNVTGAGPDSPSSPALNPPEGYSTFHPYESIRFTWIPVPDAASYVLQFSNNSSFPVGTEPVTALTGSFDNIPATRPSAGYVHNMGEGTWYVRVWAVSSTGIAGRPSNVISYTVFYNNPVPPPPSPISPTGNPTLTLPFTLSWAHVLNPQSSGYEVQISSDPLFSTIEAPMPGRTEPSMELLSLTSGQKYWRVRSHQGMASPTTTATTAWSATQMFTISSAPPTPVSIEPVRIPLYSGDDTFVTVQLTAGVPPGGATISLASSNPSVAPVPATIPMQGTHAWTQFRMIAGQVTSPTLVTLTATLNGVSASRQFTVMPPSLKLLTMTSTMSGGVSAGGIVMLNGQAPAGGAVVHFSSDSPAVSPPATVTVPAGSYSTSFSMQVSDVTTRTPATITASWNGVSTQSQITVMPAPTPTSLTLYPATIIGGSDTSDGTVTIASPETFDQYLRVTSNNPAVLPYLSSIVLISARDTRGFIRIIPAAVSQPTVVTISVTGAGVTRSADLTVNPVGTPPPPPSLSSFTVNPRSVVGGNPATGTVTLPSAAPAGGTVVAIGSNLPGAASVPASVTVPAGATSASFSVTTFRTADTTAQLTARLGDTILFAALGVTSAPPVAGLELLALNPTSVTGGSTSTGTVTLSSAAPSGGALVTLSSSNTAAATVPASVTVAAGATSATFSVRSLAVSASTSATIGATYDGATRTAALGITAGAPPVPAAPSLLSPANDARPAQPVSLDWSDVSGATSYRIQIDDSSAFSAPLVVNQTVTASKSTTTGLRAVRHWWRVQGVNSAGTAGAWSAARRFTPGAAPTAPTLSALSLSPTTVVGGNTSTGTVTLTSAAPSGGAVVTLTSSNTGATLPASITIAAGATSQTFTVSTAATSAATTATIGGAYGGVTRSAALTINPVSQPAALSAVAVSPSSVTGGTSSQGTVTLTAAAPAGGFVVTLSSGNAAATVPASVPVAQGATSATFSITTSAVATSTPVAINASAGGVARTATLTVNPPAQTATLAVTASGRSGEQVTSSPAGINVTVGSTGSASFATGTSITLTVASGRDAIWSGACSSGGSKAKTCTFTLSGNASVTANVQ